MHVMMHVMMKELCWQTVYLLWVYSSWRSSVTSKDNIVLIVSRKSLLHTIEGEDFLNTHVSMAAKPTDCNGMYFQQLVACLAISSICSSSWRVNKYTLPPLGIMNLPWVRNTILYFWVCLDIPILRIFDDLLKSSSIDSSYNNHPTTVIPKSDPVRHSPT